MRPSLAALALFVLTGCTTTLKPATTRATLDVLASEKSDGEGFLALSLVTSIDRDCGYPSFSIDLVNEATGKPLQVEFDVDQLSAMATGKPQPVVVRLPEGRYRFDKGTVYYAGMFHQGGRFPPMISPHPLGNLLATADITHGQLLHVGTLNLKVAVHFVSNDQIRAKDTLSVERRQPDPMAWQPYASLLQRYAAFYESQDGAVRWTPGRNELQAGL